METLDKKAVIDELVRAGTRPDRAGQYADVFMDYQRAQANIDQYGLIISHPRSGAPIQNPYLAIRDRASKRLANMRDVNTGDLWKTCI